MKVVRKAAARFRSRSSLKRLAFLCALSLPLIAQQSPNTATAPVSSAATSQAPARIHGIMKLDGPWRFQVGDDPRWADPDFDDSAWATISLDQTLTEQGLDSYSGYAWYRLRLQPQQLSQISKLPGNQPSGLLLTSDSVGQLAAYINGVESGHTRGMTDHPAMYQSPPFIVHLTPALANGTILLAVRTWAGPETTIKRSLLANVELGALDDINDRLNLAIERHWDQHVVAIVIVSFLFFCVAALGATLYLAQRHHSEYLWLALLCLSVAVTGTVEIAYGQALIPLSIYSVLNLWTGRVFMAVTLEFVLRFTASQHRKLVRGVQIAVLLLPLLALLKLEAIYQFFSISAEVVFCVLISVLLFRAWRRGRREAGVMLLPFFLASTADSVDSILEFAGSKHWIAEGLASTHSHLGPIEFSASAINYTVFLGSLISVILYRFVHVSQEEQRSTAEIEAARSVQAMLIPTQLPSNRNFMLESAYLPVNGVGGDFFQVLPLKDESLLIVVGDVSGKGLQAAMNASTLVGALRNEISHDPATILNHLNLVMVGEDLRPSAGRNSKAVLSFATCLCARIYPDGAMTIANAGHLSPYRDGREMELASGLPLGITSSIRYEQADFRLQLGDRLIFLSDGVVEATNPRGELFGFERTQQVSNESARYIANAAQRFGQNDDITVVSLYFALSTGQHSRIE